MFADKIIVFHLPLNDIQYEIYLEIHQDGKFLVETTTSAGNDQIALHPRAKLLNSIWKLHLTPKLNFLLENLL